MPGQHLGEGDPLFARFVREHRPVDQVADGVDARHVRAELFVDGDLPALGIERDTRFGEAQPRRVGPPADGHEDLVAGEGESFAVFGSRVHHHLLVGLHRRPGHLGFQMELEALLRQDLLHARGHFPVADGQNAGKELEHRDLRPEPPPDGSEFEADVATADDDEVLRDAVERQRLRAADDRFPVELQERQFGALAAGGQQDRLGFELGDAAVVVGHVDAIGPGEPARTVVGRHLVLLEEHADAAGERLHHVVLAGHHFAEVERDIFDLDAVPGEFVQGDIVKLGRIEERFARDAADVEARPPEGLVRPLLDAGDLEPELRRANRGDVPAWPGSDHHQIERLGHDRLKK